MSVAIMKDEASASEDDFESNGANSEEDEDVLTHDYEALEESVYGWAISMLVRDTIWLRGGTRVPMERAGRVINSMLLVGATIGLQVFLLMAVSRLLSGPAVLKIREAYGDYEHHMYPNHTELTVNGFPRGIPGYRVDTNFRTLPEDFQKEICQVPLSHPFYTTAVIFIWTMTCQLELRNIVETSIRLLWVTPRVSSLSQVLVTREGEDHIAQVEGLTLLMKGLIGGFLLLPRAVMLLLLNYLGCRWLLATLGLGDVLLNGLALEFLVLLKDLVYNVCISARNKVDTTTLLWKPLRSTNTVSFCSFFEGLVWGIATATLSILYVYRLQQVLPDYRWDVREMCQTYGPKAGPLF